MALGAKTAGTILPGRTLHRLVEAVAVTVLMLSRKERAVLLAAPFVDAELAYFAVLTLKLAMHFREVIDTKSKRAGFARFVIRFRHEPDPNLVA